MHPFIGSSELWDQYVNSKETKRACLTIAAAHKKRRARRRECCLATVFESRRLLLGSVATIRGSKPKRNSSFSWRETGML